MRHALLITPFSDLVEDGGYERVSELLAGLGAVAAGAFGLVAASGGTTGESSPSGVLATGPLPEPPLEPLPRTLSAPLPASAFNSRRGQYKATGLLAALAQKPDSVAVTLAVTGVDLFAPRLNFVFGMADQATGAAVISLHRLAPEFYGEAPNPVLLRERAFREAIHEAGHVLGLSHCTSAGCIMRFSSTIEDTDNKGPGFCSRCAASLAIPGYRADESGTS